MDKALKQEIENEYKTQIKDLEENMSQIGEFEATVRPMIGLKKFYSFINYIFSTAFLLFSILLAIAYFFFLDKSITLISELLNFNFQLDETNRFLIKIIVFPFVGMLLLLSILLKIIRGKNQIIINIGVIASDFKIRIVRMLDITRERYKNFSRTVADNSKI